jgi:YfiR/HmsC-like
MRWMRKHHAFCPKNSPVDFLRSLRMAVFLSMCLLLPVWRSFAQPAQPTEYQIKAAFLYNFAKFVDWPPAPSTVANSPIVIGILGENVFHDDLENTLHGKTISGHPIQLKPCRSSVEATNCQILFISPSEKSHFEHILHDLQGSNILTVSETDHFIEDGGIVNFVIVGKNVRFQINNDAAKKAGLTISSKLLSLAVH